MPGLTDVASGNVSMEFTDLTPALPSDPVRQAETPRGPPSKRNPDMPDVPSIAETVPGYDARSWQGFFARAGTPKDIVDRLNAALVADLKRPETATRFKALGIVAQWDTPEEFRAFIVRRPRNGSTSSTPPASSRSEERRGSPRRRYSSFAVST